MADIPKVETTGTALKLQADTLATRAAIVAGSTEFHANQVLKATEAGKAQEGMRVAAKSEVPQGSIDSLTARITDKKIQKGFIEHATRLKQFIEGGTLSRPDHAKFITEIQKVIREYKPLNDSLGTPANIDAYANWLLTTQGGTLSPEMYRRLDELLKSEPPSTEAELVRLNGVAETKKAERKIIDSDKDVTKKQQDSATLTVESFTDPTGVKKIDLDAARRDKPKNETELKTKESEISDKEKQIKDLQDDREFFASRGLTSFRTETQIQADIDNVDAQLGLATTTNPSLRDTLTRKRDVYSQEMRLTKTHTGKSSLTDFDKEIATSQGELKTKQGEKIKIETEIGKVAQLEAEFKQAQVDLQEANRSMLEIQAKLTGSDTDVNTAETAYKEAKRSFEAWEKDLVARAGRIVGESTAEWINTEAQRLEQAYDTYYAEKVKNEQDQNKQKLLNRASEMITDPRTKRKRGQNIEWRATNRTNVSTEAQYLLSNGPDKLIERYCASARITDPAEVSRLMKDESVRNNIVSEVLGRHFAANGIMPQQVEQISHSWWGEDMVQKSLDKNIEIKGQIEKVLGAGMLDSSFWSKFWHTAQKNPWLLLLILTGVVAGTVAAGPLGAGIGFGALAGGGAAAGAEAIGVARGASKMGSLEQLGM